MHFSHHFFFIKGSCFQNVQGLSVFKVNFLSLGKKYSGAFIILSEASHASHYHLIWSNLLSCSSQHLQRKALRDATMTLETLLNEARALEISETQAKDNVSSGNAANAVLPTPSQPKKNCFNCGEIWSLKDRLCCVKSQVQWLS